MIDKFYIKIREVMFACMLYTLFYSSFLFLFCSAKWYSTVKLKEHSVNTGLHLIIDFIFLKADEEHLPVSARIWPMAYKASKALSSFKKNFLPWFRNRQKPIFPCHD